MESINLKFSLALTNESPHPYRTVWNMHTFEKKKKNEDFQILSSESYPHYT